MGIIQRIKSFKSKEVDRGIKLRTYPNNGIYTDKEKGWDKLFEEISIIVEFYMFMYGIETLIDVADYRDYVVFHFPRLFNDEKKIIKDLAHEIGMLFKERVVCSAYLTDEPRMKIVFNSEKISFVK